MISRKYFLAIALMGIIASTSPFTQIMGQSDPSEIAEKAFNKVDDQLNAVYRDTLKAITRSDTRDNFIQAQRAWITFRDSEAEFRTSIGNKGGIVYAYGRTVIETELTKDRIQQLKRFKKEILDANEQRAEDSK